MKISYNKFGNKLLKIRPNKNKSFLFKIITKNLKKYNKLSNQINKEIIHNIVFDEKKRIVSIFKDYLLWDETSEFLKRFYKLKESSSRIPNICEYYENYTLYAPIYYSNEYEITKTMVKYTKRKKKYLEYIEEHEDDFKKNNNKKKKKRKENFEPLIKSELIKTANTINNTAQTIELTQYKEKKMSFSEIFDELSSTINLKKDKIYNIKDKIKHFKQNKKFINNKKLLIESSDLSKPSITNNISKTIEKKNQNNNLNIKKLHLKIPKIKELKLNLNNIYFNTNTNLNFDNFNKNSNNIVLTTIPNSERFIPTQSDDLFKEKIHKIKRNKINLFSNPIFESLTSRNVANTSRNNNKHHLVLKISNHQGSYRNNSNESKTFGTTKSRNKNNKKINLNIHSDNINLYFDKKKNSKSNVQNNLSLKKKLLLGDKKSINYPIITNNNQTPNKYIIINDNPKYKSVVKRNANRNNNNYLNVKNNTLNIKRQFYQY